MCPLTHICSVQLQFKQARNPLTSVMVVAVPLLTTAYTFYFCSLKHKQFMNFVSKSEISPSPAILCGGFRWHNGRATLTFGFCCCKSEDALHQPLAVDDSDGERGVMLSCLVHAVSPSPERTDVRNRLYLLLTTTTTTTRLSSVLTK